MKSKETTVLSDSKLQSIPLLKIRFFRTFAPEEVWCVEKIQLYKYHNNRYRENIKAYEKVI